MIARKCDRCGAYYDEPQENEVSGFFWRVGAEASENRDLCPKCTEELSEWMEGAKFEKPESTAPEPEKIPYVKPVTGNSVEEVTKPKKTPMTDTQKAEILSRHLAGEEIRLIANSMGANVKQVSGFIRAQKLHHPELFEKNETEQEESESDSQPE